MDNTNDKLKAAGAELANIAYNLGQPIGMALTPEIRASLAAAAKAWDEAKRAARGTAGSDRAAAIEEAAKLADEWAAARVPDGGGNALRNYAAALRAGAALTQRPPAPRAAVSGAGAVKVPEEWLSEQCGPAVDGLSYGQGFRRGFNQCRSTVLELNATQPVKEAAAQEEEADIPELPGTTRADIDRISVEALWNRWIGDKSYGTLAKESFFAARAIPPKRTAVSTAEPTPPDDELVEATFMSEDSAWKWAWKNLRTDLGDSTWTTGESGTYHGFFMHGWRYGRQYEKQARTALRHAPVPNVGELAQAALDAQLRQEVVIMYQMLDEGEWAEHIATTPHGQCLETAITRLVGRANKAIAGAAPNPDAEDAARLNARLIEALTRLLERFAIVYGKPMEPVPHEVTIAESALSAARAAAATGQAGKAGA